MLRQTDRHTNKHQHYNKLALHILYHKVPIRDMVQRCRFTDRMNSLTNDNISTMLVTECTEINNRLSRILHFADQKYMPNIANGT